MPTEVTVALIAGMFTIPPLVVKWLVDRSAQTVMSKNTEEHQMNAAVLLRIEEKVDATAEVMTNHLEWHVSTAPSPKEAA